MTAKDLYRAMNGASDAQLERRPFPVKRLLLGLAAAAACLALIAVLRSKDSTQLTPGVTLRYEEPRFSAGFAASSESQLVAFTEEELLFPDQWETDIFRGEIVSIQNISIDFNGDKSWRAIAEVAVDKVWRGGLTPGGTASILLPCSITDGQWVEDTDTVVHMREGMRGIFMPIRYDEDSVWQQNGATLYLQDAAPYGFADGMRYAFLETGSGLVFARHAWPSLASAVTMEDLEARLEALLEQ